MAKPQAAAAADDPMARDVARRQTWSAAGYRQNARFVSALGAEILGWLDPRPGDVVLDLGCGDGALTLEIQASGARVVGVDISQNLLVKARQRGLDVRVMDGEALTFERDFDAVFSNAALHWMSRPERVVAGVARALKPGGRFVAEFGGHGNMAAVITALRALAQEEGVDPALAGPWFFPTPKAYAQLLEAAGFTVERIELVPRPTPLPTGLAGWLETFAKIFLDQFDAAGRRRVIARAEDLLEPSLRDEAGVWTADYVRLRVAARGPTA